MRHCAIITAYKNTAFINRLIDKLPADWGVYMHIDRKSNINVSEINSRAIQSKNRRKIYWGSFEHVMAFLDMMEEALHSTEKYDFFHLITGQDYPCTDLSHADTLCDANHIYINYFTVPRADWETWEGGRSFFKYKLLVRHYDARNVILKRFNRLCKIMQAWKKESHYMPEYDVYGGTIYCSLPRFAVEYILKADLTQDLISRLKYSLSGEEVFLQTILLNSPYREQIINNNLRYIDWTSTPKPPKTLTSDDFAKIMGANALFCRKVDPIASKDLLALLDKEI